MKFIERIEAPAFDNKYYKSINKGGYNRCLEINNGSVLPNCVGYGYGRFMELQGINSCRLSTGDAKNFYNNTADGYKRGQEPKLGAIICFDGGNYGHIAIVEEINDDYILTSNSVYGGSKFYMKKYYKKDGYSFQGNTGYYKCQGFIYPEVEFGGDNPEPTPIPPTTLKYKEGDRVIFNGILYGTAFMEAPGQSRENYACTITDTHKDGTAPYNIDNGLGWVTEDSLTPYVELQPTPEETIKEGDFVVPIEKIDYYGTSVVQYDDKYQVTELVGDRAVLCALRDGQLVTWCAMNINNIKKA